MATIPVLPSLAAGQIVTAAHLTAIAATCTFLMGKPMARAHDAAGNLSIGTGFTSIPFNTLDFDTDTIYSGAANIRLTAKTPAWYKCRYSIQIASAATSRAFNSKVILFAGPSNPNAPANTVIGASLDGYTQQNSVGGTAYCGATGLIPWYMYAGDYLNVRVQANATGGKTGIDSGMPQSCWSIEFVSA